VAPKQSERRKNRSQYCSSSAKAYGKLEKQRTILVPVLKDPIDCIRREVVIYTTPVHPPLVVVSVVAKQTLGALSLA
jgi:hypothetical protein